MSNVNPVEAGLRLSIRRHVHCSAIARDSGVPGIRSKTKILMQLRDGGLAGVSVVVDLRAPAIDQDVGRVDEARLVACQE
jgi:hypothetical protein